MSLAPGTLVRLRRQLREYRASLPPSFCILDQEPGETAEAWEARVAETERAFAAVRAKGGAAFLYVIRDEDPRP